MCKKNKKGFISLFLHNILVNKIKNKNELLTLIKDIKTEKIINKNTYNIIKQTIKIEKKKVKDIMIPRIKIKKLNINDTFEKCIKKVIKFPYTKFPIINYEKNYINGFLIVKDLFKYIPKNNKIFSLKEIIKPPIIVPESQKINRILKDFKLKQNNFSIVVDEFGVISGLITMKDILNVIFKKKTIKKFTKNN
ncbi:Magnesium and cobalt efflux protein CorC [Buchnera aphidicola (Periphyllus testudinaceus)]|uniref:CBS domain-containing protein n=1 Tax=Buchnera aphidicola TaxID=9 RepID=UPI003464225F